MHLSSPRVSSRVRVIQSLIFCAWFIISYPMYFPSVFSLFTYLNVKNIRVTNDHGYVSLVVNTSRPVPHSWLVTGFVTKITRRVPQV